MQDQPNNPLHGVKLADMLDALVDNYGWEHMAFKVNINCFKIDPSIKSSLVFLRRTAWARNKVEAMYLEMMRKKWPKFIAKRCSSAASKIRKHQVGLQKYCEEEGAAVSLVLDKRNE